MNILIEDLAAAIKDRRCWQNAQSTGYADRQVTRDSSDQRTRQGI
ncbi:MAG TPA: hypothetical protein VLY63_20390 [Anaerolineae bacterium]|nr:hypothetical protein [Anaerolineae bacterium]